MFAAVILVIGLAYWFTRLVGQGAMGTARGTDRTGRLKVAARLALGREQQLLVVQAGERYFLLGVTASEISTLAEFTAQEAEQWRFEAEQRQTAPPTFKEALRNVAAQKRKR